MSIIRFPGFIDVHVHLRDPGATQKEDFYTGTRAGTEGGFTFVLDMPNNPLPTISLKNLEEKIRRADARAVCDVGFHYGTDGKNLETFSAAAAHPPVYGLKIYANHTTGDLLIEDRSILAEIVDAWPDPKPILAHAEGEQLALMIDLAERSQRHLHVCHISRYEEVELVRRAKARNLPITAGVCPHHLFLVDDKATRAMGGYVQIKPPLGTVTDQTALWAGITDGTIDLIETDHAPHTKAEKESANPPFGVPGLETAALLLLAAEREGKLTIDHIRSLLHDRPGEIFNIPDQPDTFVEFDLDHETVIGSSGYATKAGWSPFDGWTVPARLVRVVLRGETVVPSRLPKSEATQVLQDSQV